VTLGEVRQEVERIRACAGDDEAAHSYEDDLRHKFIEYVASQGGQLAEMAKLVLSTTDIDFARWCA